MFWKKRVMKPKFHIGDKVILTAEKEIWCNNPPKGEIVGGRKSFYMDTGDYFLYEIKFPNKEITKYFENNLEKA